MLQRPPPPPPANKYVEYVNRPAGLAPGGPRPSKSVCGWSHRLSAAAPHRPYDDHPDGGDGWMPGCCTNKAVKSAHLSVPCNSTGCRIMQPPRLSCLLAKLARSTSPQKPPATYTRVNDFRPHRKSLFRGVTYTWERLIREYIRILYSML